jgi:hypothetical protein
MQPVWNLRGSRRWSILLTFEKLMYWSKPNQTRPLGLSQANSRLLGAVSGRSLSASKLTGSALLDAPFSDGDRAGTKPNGFEL